MPNNAASVFSQLRAKAEERGKEIGTFVQRGTTFQNAHAKVQIIDCRVLYHLKFHTRTGEEEHLGGFDLKDRGRATTLINLLAKSHRSMSAKVQREP